MKNNKKIELESEIQSLNQRHNDEIAALIKTFDDEILSLSEKYSEQKDSISKIHILARKKLDQDYKSECDDIRARQDEAIASLKNKQKQEVKRIKLKKHKNKIIAGSLALVALICVPIVGGVINNSSSESAVVEPVQKSYSVTEKYIPDSIVEKLDSDIYDFCVDTAEKADSSDEEKLNELEERYKKLSSEQQSDIKNYGLLVLARERINNIKISQENAKKVSEQIDTLENVNLDDEEKILIIRNEYNKLSDEEKALVTNSDKLEKAESRVLTLKTEKQSLTELNKESNKASSSVDKKSSATTKTTQKLTKKAAPKTTQKTTPKTTKKTTQKTTPKTTRKTTQRTTPKPTRTTTAPNRNQGASETVYWVASGQVYHRISNCPSLNRSSYIYSGPIPDGRRPCKNCYH